AHGAKVCVLSGQKDSKLAKIADYTLLTSTRSFKPSVVTSGVATFAVIDALFVMASLIQQDDSDESDEE
ncbi:MurR/RpiR family transcriptional regulator, partial [Dysosmobacter welbionis]